MDYEKLKEVIAKQIKDNGRGEITGPVLQAVLMAMVDSLGEVYPQTYTDEQKTQARANIDALSDYDGEITKEKLSVEVQAILDDVSNKQNITDENLATIAKTIVGAINELFNGGVKNNSITTEKLKDQAVEYAKLSASIRSTLDMVGTNVKIINEDADLNTLTEDGLYLLSAGHSYTNYPNSDGASSGVMYPNAASLLIVSYGHTETTLTQLLVSVSNSYFFPMIRCRSNYGNGWANWNNDLMYPLYDEAHNSVKKQDLLSLTDTEVNNIWDNN